MRNIFINSNSLFISFRPCSRCCNKVYLSFCKSKAANKDFSSFEAREVVADGDKVVALGHWDAKSKKTGNPYSGDWAMAFYFRDGKICEHREYYDSYGEAMASKG